MRPILVVGRGDADVDATQGRLSAPPGRSRYSLAGRSVGLSGRASGRAQNSRDLATEQGKANDRDEPDERQDERVFRDPLAFLAAEPGPGPDTTVQCLKNGSHRSPDRQRPKIALASVEKMRISTTGS